MFEGEKMEKRTYQLIAVRYKKSNDFWYTRTEFGLHQEKKRQNFWRRN